MMQAPRPRDEAGQTTLMIVGLSVLLMMVIAVVVDASAAYLQRQGLDNVADGAALAGADAGAAGEEVYVGGLGARLDLYRQSAAAGVAEYLGTTRAHERFPGLTHRVHVDPSTRSVVVTVHAPLDLPLTVPGAPRRARIGATGSAVVQTAE